MNMKQYCELVSSSSASEQRKNMIVKYISWFKMLNGEQKHVEMEIFRTNLMTLKKDLFFTASSWGNIHKFLNCKNSVHGLF